MVPALPHPTPSGAAARRGRALVPARAAWAALGLSGPALLLARGLPSPPSALSVWLDVGYGWWAAITLLVLETGIGATLLRLPALGECAPPGPFSLLLRQVAGRFVSSSLLMALSLPWGLRAPVAVAGVLAMIALAAPGLAGLLREARAPNTPAARGPARRRGLMVLAALLGAAWVVPFLLQTALPDSDWDGAAYHIPMARLFVAGGIGATDPFLPQADFPGSTHVLYALLLAVGAESGIVPLNFLTVLATLLGTWGLARHLGGARAGFAALALLAPNAILWEVGVDSRIDGFLASYYLAALGAFLLWLERRDRAGLLAVAGMALGLSVGTKYTAWSLVAVVGLSGCVLAAAAPRGERGRSLRGVAAGALFVLLPAGFWYARNAAVLGDPVYPFLNGLVYPDLEGRLRRFQPDMERLLETSPRPPPDYLASIRPDPSVRRNMLRLWDVVAHPAAYDDKLYAARTPSRLNPVLLLFFLLPLFLRDRRILWIHGIGTVLFFATAASIYVLRYVLPLLPVLSVGLALPLARRRWSLALAGLAAVPLLGWNLLAEVTKVRDTLKPRAFLEGRLSRIEWLRGVGYNGATAAPALAMFVNGAIREGRIPADATILLVGEEKTGLLECRNLPDMSRDGYRWLVEMVRHEGDTGRILRSLAERGIGYVALNLGYLHWVLRTVPMDRRTLANRSFLLFSLFHVVPFLKRHGVLIFSKEEIYLFRLVTPR